MLPQVVCFSGNANCSTKVISLNAMQMHLSIRLDNLKTRLSRIVQKKDNWIEQVKPCITSHFYCDWLR